MIGRALNRAALLDEARQHISRTWPYYEEGVHPTPQLLDKLSESTLQFVEKALCKYNENMLMQLMYEGKKFARERPLEFVDPPTGHEN